MKFMLVISLCSFIHQSCKPIDNGTTLHDDWNKCMETGYIASIKILNDIGREEVNKYQIGTQIMCYQTKGII